MNQTLRGTAATFPRASTCAFIVALGASLAASAAFAAMAPANPTAAKAKKAMVALVAGTYGKSCMSMVDSTPSTMPAPVIVGADGHVGVGKATDDVLQPAWHFNLAASTKEQPLMLTMDMKGESGAQRSYIIGTNQDGTGSAAAISEGVKPATTTGCSGPKPTGVGVDVWAKLAAPLIAASGADLHCVDMKTGRLKTASASLAADKLVIDGRVMSATQPRTFEGLDVDAEGGISFSVADQAQNLYMIGVDARGKVVNASIHDPKDSNQSIVCKVD